MTSKGLALALASAVVFGACGGIARPDSGVMGADTTVAQSAAASADPTHPSTITVTPSTTPVEQPSVVDLPEPSRLTASTAPTLGGSTSTTTNPAESIDLAEVRDALDALDALFGDLDSQVGSVDLNEGETP